MNQIQAVDDVSARYHAITAHCRTFAGADTPRSLRILALNLLLYAGLLWLMYVLLPVSYGLSALLSVPAAFMLVRIFIVQHDCGHGSFFKTRLANKWAGRALSLLTWTPYTYWQREHDVHHAFVGQIERQDIGYIDILTAEGYRALPPHKKFLYRLYRNPLVLLFIGVPLHNIVLMRVPPLSPRRWDARHFLSFKGAWASVMAHNLCLLVLYGAIFYFFGAAAVFAVYLPVLALAWIIGGWMFYVHHHFENAYWQSGEAWHPHEARLLASAHYRLPPIMHWLTGYIGLHHIHHFSSGIPHYKLQACMDALPALLDMNAVTWRQSLSSVWLAIIDPAQRKMLRLRDIVS